jgi:lipopolysaccharide export system permease protein
MILYRYIIKEHIFPFCLSLSVIVFYFIMQFAVMLLSKIIEKGLDPLVVLEVFAIQLGWIIALAIPMAILIASLWVFGRMSGDNEITSIKASGQSLFPLMIPVFAAAGVFTILLIQFNDLILPDANHRAANLQSDISQKKPAAFIDPKVLIRDFPGYTIYTEEVDARTGELRGIRIFCDIQNQDPSTTIAARGTVRMTNDEQYLELTLYDGETHSISRQNGNGYFMGRFGKQVTYIKNIDSQLKRTNHAFRGSREMDSKAMLTEVNRYRAENASATTDYRRFIDSLARQVASLDSLGKIYGTKTNPASPRPGNFSQWAKDLTNAVPVTLNSPARLKIQEATEIAERTVRKTHSNDLIISDYMVEVHKKYAIPLACIVFVLIGAPLGIMARRGGLTIGASYGIFFFILYWTFLIGGEALGDSLKISPFFAMWSGNIFIGLCGVVLIILMLRETTIRFTAITQFWRKYLGANAKFSRGVSSSIVGRTISLLVKAPKWILKRTIGTLPMYLINLFTGYVVGILSAAIVVFIIIDYISNLNQFKNALVPEIVQYYLAYMPWIINLCFPIVLLLATMFAMGKLAKHSEITAMKAAGIGIRRLTLPLLILGIFLSAGIFYTAEKVLPAANAKKRELSEIFREPPGSPRRLQRSKVGVPEYRRNFYYFGDRKTIYMFQEFNTSPQLARGVWREIFDSSSLKERIQAEGMIHDSTGWRFTKGAIRRYGVDGCTYTPFDTLHDSLLAVPPEIMVARIKSKEEMSYWELRGFIEATKRRGEQVRKYLGDLEFKLAFPLMNFIVILLGVAITARIGRKGSALLFIIGLVMVFAYWLISQFAIAFAQNGYMPIFVGAWIGNAIFLVLGLLLYRKASL